MKSKKSLGQNFLKDRAVLAKIIKAADLRPADLVIEIGPGTGILTEELVKYAGKIIAIEKDNNLAKELDSRWLGNDKVEIINDDILKINLPELIKNASVHRPHPVRLKVGPPSPSKGEGDNEKFLYKVVANIPYYITSPIIQLFLETEFPPKEMIFMVQKEVAERICSKPGQMSILAVSVQYYAQPELLFYVPKTAFWPVPEVDSAVIKITPFHLTPSSSPCLPDRQAYKGEGSSQRKKFFRIVKAGFSAKRKTLLNNLSNSLHLPKKTVEEKIKKAGIDPASRAQELSIDDWKKLSSHFT